MPAERAIAPFLRYAMAGAVGTAAQFLVMITLVERAGVGAVSASTAGAIAGAAINYGLNYHLTFRSSAPHRKALPKFATVSIGGVVLNAALVAGAMKLGVDSYVLAQAIATIVVFGGMFAVNRFWTF